MPDKQNRLCFLLLPSGNDMGSADGPSTASKSRALTCKCISCIVQGKSDNYGAANFIVWPGNYIKEERCVVLDMNTQGGKQVAHKKFYSFKSLTRNAN